MNIIASSPVVDFNLNQKAHVSSQNKRQLFAIKSDSVSFGAKEEPNINWEWLDDIEDIVKRLLAKDNSTKTISAFELKKVYRYFGYDIPSGGTKKGNTGSSGSGDDHGFKHSAFDIYITIGGGQNEADRSAVGHLKNALRRINETNGELLPPPRKGDRSKTSVTDDDVNKFIAKTSKYDEEKNTNKYRANLEKAKEEQRQQAADAEKAENARRAQQEAQEKANAQFQQKETEIKAEEKKELEEIEKEIINEYKEEIKNLAATFANRNENVKKRAEATSKMIKDIADEANKSFGKSFFGLFSAIWNFSENLKRLAEIYKEHRDNQAERNIEQEARSISRGLDNLKTVEDAEAARNKMDELKKEHEKLCGKLINEIEKIEETAKQAEDDLAKSALKSGEAVTAETKPEASKEEATQVMGDIEAEPIAESAEEHAVQESKKTEATQEPEQSEEIVSEEIQAAEEPEEAVAERKNKVIMLITSVESEISEICALSKTMRRGIQNLDDILYPKRAGKVSNSIRGLREDSDTQALRNRVANYGIISTDSQEVTALKRMREYIKDAEFDKKEAAEFEARLNEYPNLIYEKMFGKKGENVTFEDIKTLINNDINAINNLIMRTGNIVEAAEAVEAVAEPIGEPVVEHAVQEPEEPTAAQQVQEPEETAATPEPEETESATPTQETPIQTAKTQTEREWAKELFDKLTMNLVSLPAQEIVSDMRTMVQNIFGEEDLATLETVSPDEYVAIIQNKINELSKSVDFREAKRAESFAVIQNLIKEGKITATEEIYLVLPNLLDVLNRDEINHEETGKLYLQYRAKLTEKQKEEISALVKKSDKDIEEDKLSKLLEDKCGYLAPISDTKANKELRKTLLKLIIRDYDKAFGTSHSLNNRNIN